MLKDECRRPNDPGQHSAFRIDKSHLIAVPVGLFTTLMVTLDGYCFE
jgi:hypothetical protein